MSETPYNEDAVRRTRGRTRLSTQTSYDGYADLSIGDEDRTQIGELVNSAQLLHEALTRTQTDFINDFDIDLSGQLEEYDLVSQDDVSGPSVSSPQMTGIISLQGSRMRILSAKQRYHTTSLEPGRRRRLTLAMLSKMSMSPQKCSRAP